MSNKFHDIFAYFHKVFYTSFSQLVASQDKRREGENGTKKKADKRTSRQTKRDPHQPQHAAEAPKIYIKPELHTTNCLGAKRLKLIKN